MDALYNLYLDDRQKYRQAFDKENAKKQKNIKRAATIAGVIMIGGLALGRMSSTSMQHIDLETVATYDEDAIREENNKDLIAISEAVELETINTNNTVQIQMNKPTADEEIELNEEEITAIVNTPLVQVDVDAVYDQGIEDNIKQYEQDIIERGNKWGVSPNLIHDIISQESSGGKTTNEYGITQFEFRWWDEKPLTVYNFEEGEYQTVVFSNDATKWNGKADIIISEKDLENTKTQISVAAILLQYYFNKYGHNIPLAIQAYNRGETNMNELFRLTTEGEGITISDIIYDQTNLSWIKYAYKDKWNLTYFEEIIKHIDKDQQVDGINDPYSILYLDNDGNVQTQSFQGQVKTSQSR